MNKEYNPEQGLPNPNQQQPKDTGNGESGWRDLPRDLQLTYGMTVIGGLKASLSNDNNSEEAKQADRWVEISITVE